MNNLKDVGKFKFWAHHIIPLAYDDSLSYYEFLCKVLQKLNEVIDSLNAQNDEIERFESEVQEMFANLREELLGYFEQLRAELLAEIKRFENLFFEDFSEDKDYLEGDYVLKDGEIYRALSSIQAGPWDSGEWLNVVFGNDVVYWKRWLINRIDTGLETLMGHIAVTYEDGNVYPAQTIAWHNGSLWTNPETVTDAEWVQEHWVTANPLSAYIREQFISLRTAIANEAETREAEVSALKRNKSDMLDEYVYSAEFGTMTHEIASSQTRTQIHIPIGEKVHVEANEVYYFIVRQSNTNWAQLRDDDNDPYVTIELLDSNEHVKERFTMTKGRKIGDTVCGMITITPNYTGDLQFYADTKWFSGDGATVSEDFAIYRTITQLSEDAFLGAYEANVFRRDIDENDVRKFTEKVYQRHNAHTNVPVADSSSETYDILTLPSATQDTLIVMKATHAENVASIGARFLYQLDDSGILDDATFHAYADNEIIGAIKASSGHKVQLYFYSGMNNTGSTINMTADIEVLFVENTSNIAIEEAFGCMSFGAFGQMITDEFNELLASVSPETIVHSENILSIVQLTQQEYDAIVTPDARTMYVIVG